MTGLLPAFCILHAVFSSSHVLEFSSSRVLEFSSSRVLEFSSSRVPEFSSSRVLEFSSSRVPEFSSSRVLEFSSSRVLEFSSSRVLEFSSSRVLEFSTLQTPPSDTFFTSPPHFRWWIILYFFVGGISGGALMVASLLRLFGAPVDRPYIRLAVYMSFVGTLVSAGLLIVDLTIPLRFWHMLIQNNTGAPILKWWSPMSVGAWGLLVFGFFSGLATLRALREDKRLTWSTLEYLDRPAISTFGALGGIFGGLFLAGYTGVLLSVSNRPIWADSSWLGLLFLLSGISTSVAALLLLARWQRVDAVSTEDRLKRFDKIALVLELVVIVIFVASLGAVARAFLNAWGVLLVFGVIGAGILLPLYMARDTRRFSIASASLLVLFGGLALRMVTLLSSEQFHVAGAQVFR